MVHLKCSIAPRVPQFSPLVNPRPTCAARVTVVGSVCLSMLQPLDCLFVPETIPSTAQVTTISLIQPFILNMLRCRDLSAATIVRIQTVGHFYSAENAHAQVISTTWWWKSPFISLERKKTL